MTRSVHTTHVGRGRCEALVRGSSARWHTHVTPTYRVTVTPFLTPITLGCDRLDQSDLSRSNNRNDNRISIPPRPAPGYASGPPMSIAVVVCGRVTHDRTHRPLSLRHQPHRHSAARSRHLAPTPLGTPVARGQ
jgi:hypothetical protein